MTVVHTCKENFIHSFDSSIIDASVNAHTCAVAFNMPRYDFHVWSDMKVSKMSLKALKYYF